MAATATATGTQTANQITEEVTKRLEETAERFKEVNAAVTESTKAGNRVVVDNYEKAARSFFDLQRQLSGTAQINWVKDTTATQIQFAEDVTEAWVKAARRLLK